MPHPEAFTGRMLALHAEIVRLRSLCVPMPDDAMDALGDAAASIRKAIIDAPITSEADIANKFRLAVILIEDPDGDMSDEPMAVRQALFDLIGFRNDLWNADFGTGTGHPFYRAGFKP
ncbi:hypothetical protein [Rhizobium sp. PEPV16]|uniref:hypothetical protein n=1 Tax=Rhizobium sp. PEPV16 TaxID=1820614 RepID=UPI00124F3DF0|nr:hypothetical protein [Rhizobium sp. PEPV16]KAF5887450.1 hypothetical protein FY112_03110 [Rhizobium sp. PEPV16]